MIKTITAINMLRGLNEFVRYAQENSQFTIINNIANQVKNGSMTIENASQHPEIWSFIRSNIRHYLYKNFPRLSVTGTFEDIAQNTIVTLMQKNLVQISLEKFDTSHGVPYSGFLKTLVDKYANYHALAYLQKERGLPLSTDELSENDENLPQGMEYNSLSTNTNYTPIIIKVEREIRQIVSKGAMTVQDKLRVQELKNWLRELHTRQTEN